MNTGKLLLTSTGLSSENVAKVFQSFFPNPETKAVAIVTTAAEDKDQNKYSQLAKKQFEEMGFARVDFVDLETEPAKSFSSYAVIYVCGGNTFKLLKFARTANFQLSIDDLLMRNGVYVGVSAGSIIVGPSIDIANEVEPDANIIGLKDFTGFNIINLIIHPHYSIEVDEEIKNFEKKYGVAVERLNDLQAILIENGEKTIIG
ncbi:MAG: Type 1 glutamine amidotransferase-like domain-containing protein [Candidatus Buchananbacteria bacterium]|nr:Type 1 glutamine amidotransferase-like domain-containing protein [Candidatus Buchananbacteria bacterium]